MYKRLIPLNKRPKRSFFIWGPRQVGKSTLLRHLYPEALTIDFLKSDEFIRFQQNPKLFREIVGNQPSKTLTVVDEVQKVPLLLDEVHWLIENKDQIFALSGSSARKLKRGHANLLGGRALRHVLLGLTLQEIGQDFNLEKILNQGNLPSHFLCDEKDWLPLMRSYVADYLKEEIAAEAAVKNLPAFSSFLSMAALSDTEPVNFSRFGSDVGVSGHTIKEYFEILVETYQGAWLPAFVKRAKRRTRQTPKFYFDNVGIVNYLAKRGKIVQGSELFGKAFESFIFHELRCYVEYKNPELDLSYWSLTTQSEVDFILGLMEIAVEVKSSSEIRSSHLKSLRDLKVEYPKVKNRILVCNETHPRKTEDGILIMPYPHFLESLWQGSFFQAKPL